MSEVHQHDPRWEDIGYQFGPIDGQPPNVRRASAFCPSCGERITGLAVCGSTHGRLLPLYVDWSDGTRTELDRP